MNLNPWSEPEIQIYYGLTGSGKTYSAVEQILDWVKFGGNVVTNISVRRFSGKGKVTYCEGESIRNHDFSDMATGHPLLLAIDEAQLLFGNRDWAKFPGSLTSLMTQHRKLNISIIVICQNPTMLDVTFSKLAYYSVSHYNCCRQSIFAPILSIFTSNLHFACQREMVGGKPKKTIHRRIFRIRKFVRDKYNTVQLLDSNKKMPLKKGNPYRKYFLLFILAILLFAMRNLDGLAPRKAALAQELAKKSGPVVVKSIDVELLHVYRSGDYLDCIGKCGEETMITRVPVDSVAGSSVSLDARIWPRTLWKVVNDGVVMYTSENAEGTNDQL
jgi:hypothetical protein